MGRQKGTNRIVQLAICTAYEESKKEKDFQNYTRQQKLAYLALKTGLSLVTINKYLKNEGVEIMN